MSIRLISTEQLRRMGDQEGLILQGCGGDPQEWVDGINEILAQEGILKKGAGFEEAYTFRHDGLTCMLFPFKEDIELDVGKLAAWRLETLYGISKTAGVDLLNALGLGNGANRYEKADGSDQLDDSKYYYQSDVLISALSTALKANATTVKNALEAYVTESGTAMPLTDTYGKTKAENLELGLYLVVETKVPEMVTSTCNPFFICLPMTSSGGSWIYDVTVYPKNLTGNPTLDKTLRESKDDTGKHNGSGSITDGYADTGTASDGDSVDYQIISTLPSITSASTYLTCYTFTDTLSKGITYNKHDVVLEFFTDAACTDPVARWAETDGKFTVT